ncbi:hypothetical protein Tco_0408462 [Tanacetum coccineum]
MLHPLRNQSVVRQPTAFKSERPKSSKPQFASQVDMNNDLPKPITTHYFPREREFAFTKPHHMIAPRSSRYSTNDMVQNHYQEEAKKKTQEIGTFNLSAGTSFNPKREGLRVCSSLRIQDHGNEPSSLMLVPKVVPPANTLDPSLQELELLFSPMYEEYFTAGN